MLTWAELQDVILDVEVTLNNRPLSYVEDDLQLPVLTPNSLLFGQPNPLPELECHHLETPDRYLKRCKDVMRKRWTDEYLRADVSKYRPEVYKSKKSKILKKIPKVALGKLLT